MANLKKSDKLYPHPFSKAYWRDAVLELTDLRMLVVAALMIAVRLVMKTFLAIPLAPSLNINTAFIANAAGAMIFGPVVAAICAVITDILGYMLKPVGFYFPPMILTEVAGSVIFALFFYRAKITPVRVMLSRFAICLGVNILLGTPLQIWYNAVFTPNSTYILTIPTIIKNLFSFPLESVALTLFLSVLVPITTRMGLTYGNKDVKENLKFGKRQVVLLVVLFVVGLGSTLAYLNYHYSVTSVSAGYSTEERPVKNREALENIRTQTGDFNDENTVAVIESAMHPFLSKITTYTVGVYQVDPEALAEEEKTMDDLWAYSKSPASKDPALTRLATVTFVLDENTGEITEFQSEPVK